MGPGMFSELERLFKAGKAVFVAAAACIVVMSTALLIALGTIVYLLARS